MNDNIMKFFNIVNSIFSAIIVGISELFSGQRVLFLGYLILNIIDFVTVTIKARITKKESSSKGLMGIIKKVGYWILILITFLASYMLSTLGNLISVDIDFVILFGWFTLGCLIINEFRSILENLSELGIKLPDFLINGLEVIQNIIEKNAEEIENKKDEQNKKE